MLYNWTLNALEYTVVYLISVFVKWEFYNPFWWWFELPNFSMMARGAGLFYIVIWQGFQIGLLYEALKPKK